jgi:plasmid stability protein
MASITIRNIDDSLKNLLRIRAAHRHRSMEEEVRHILKDALRDEPVETENLAVSIQQRFRDLGGVELTIQKRQGIRKPPIIGS